MARTLRRNRDRLIPINDIKWLSHPERAAQRKNLKLFEDLILGIEEPGRELTQEQIQFLIDYTGGSDNEDIWLNACWDTFETTESSYHTILAQMGQHDLSAYHEFMRPEEPPAFHHQWLCEKLMASERGDLGLLVISLPPGSAKSTYGSRSYVQWFLGRHPNRRVLAVGHGQKFVEDEFSKPNRDTIDSEQFRAVFPDVYLSENDRGATTWKIEEHGGIYTCRGANAGVAGVRANLLDIDDPIKSVKDALSEVSRDALFRWITADLLSRRLPGAPIVLIMTRWHSDDPAGRLEELHKKNPNALPGPVEFINIPAQAEEDDPLGREKGAWLWEEFYGAGHYETLRETMSPGLWSALYGGKPLDKMGTFVSEDMFQRYDSYPVNKPDMPIQVKKTVITVDTAQKATERSAYTAIEVIREGVDGKHYMVYAERVQDKLEDVMKLMRRIATNWDANYILVEDAGQGSQIIENYAETFICPIVPFTPRGKGSKEFMFDAATPWISSGKVLFPKQAPWLTDLINEMVAFPDGKYKDYVDAFAQYCAHVFKRSSGGTKKAIMGA